MDVACCTLFCGTETLKALRFPPLTLISWMSLSSIRRFVPEFMCDWISAQLFAGFIPPINTSDTFGAGVTGRIVGTWGWEFSW